MRLTHLTDSEIQSYLDREDITPLFQRQVSNHLAGCDSCAGEVTRYENLYGDLRVSETDECSDSLANKVMASLPDPAESKLWQAALGWGTHVFSTLLFLGILVTPFNLTMPSISIPSLSWPTIAELPVVSSVMQVSKTAFSAEQLPVYLFALLAGLVMFNLNRIIFGVQRQKI